LRYGICDRSRKQKKKLRGVTRVKEIMCVKVIEAEKGARDKGNDKGGRQETRGCRDKRKGQERNEGYFTERIGYLYV
jgi:hypothetical protein